MTPETIDQYRSFIDGLFERTKQRKLKWSIYDDLTIETEIDGIPISLSEIKPDGERKSTDYAIGIYNESGEKIESFTDMDLYVDDLSDHELNYWEKMEQILFLARRQASGAAGLLDRLIAKLAG